MEHLMKSRFEIIEGYFGMLDTNKWLKFNASTEEQYKKALEFEKHIWNILKELAVPEKQY